MLMEEFFDVVDESGKVIGKQPRSVVHSSGLLHRSVYFFVFDRDFKVFVNQRSSKKDVFPDYWSLLLGGHLSSGEGFDEAVVREIAEETGIKNRPFFITNYRNFWCRKDREIAKVYGVMADGHFKIDKSEIKQGSFLTLAGAKKKLASVNALPETGDMLKILENFLKNRS
jgi:isopentenyldiphosphate isomerase